MDKLELNLNDLEVNSFQANPDKEEKKGTVHGNITQDPDRCESVIYTCYDTCDATCGDTCDLTCGLTCNYPECGPTSEAQC